MGGSLRVVPGTRLPGGAKRTVDVRAPGRTATSAPTALSAGRILGLQNAAGNAAVSGLLAVQRDDDKDAGPGLQSARFKDNARLQLAFKEKPPLTPNDSGEPVRLVQEALVGAGESMPKSTKPDGTMDGVWGDETKRALRRYQARRGLPTIDGTRAGKETLGSLDTEKSTAALIPPTGDLSFTQLETILRDRWGVTVVVGQRRDQDSEVMARDPVRTHQPPLTFPSERTWPRPDLPATSPNYRAIIDAFEQMAKRLGGIGLVTTLRFFAVDWKVSGGRLVQDVSTVGSYSAPTITMYTSAYTTSDKRLLERSTSAGPAKSEQLSGTAAVTSNVLHELGHSVEEQVTKGHGGAAAADPTLMAEFRQAAGWFDSPQELFDGGHKDVEAVRKRQAKDPTARPSPDRLVTTKTWDSSSVFEQPVTEYSLDGPGDDFAESLSAFIARPAALLARAPRRFKVLKKHQAKWAASHALVGPKPAAGTVDKKAVSGTVTASALRIRTRPGTSSPSIGMYARGETIDLLRQVVGEPVEGNTTWFATDRGFVAGRFVTASGPVPD